ncbi:penicillin-binding protein 1A [Tepidiphilus succinatimandens]|uniref:penicillin-binding protein 1A n=1 Tax=Tepidiphilus succinatimandens TaxID=224436 RepID=UPI00112F5E86|nr:PBP1A family penicillin-binding protein [Tepidiphilus succinatimandens]
MSRVKTSILALFALGIAACGILATTIVLAWQQLPTLDQLIDYQPKIPLRVYSAEGEPLAEFGEEKRVVLNVNVIPDHLKQAILAAEDERFYEHPGIDVQGIVRAAFVNFVRGGKAQGASTITMQVARNFYLSREKTFNRKFYEILLALKIERELSKDQILELYLNQIYLGQRAYGFAAAAQTYFGKPVQALTLAEAALLAGLPKAPSQLNPIRNPEAAKKRREYVLSRMLEAGFITQEQYAAAVAEPIVLAQDRYRNDPTAINGNGVGQYVAEMARLFALERFGDAAYTAGIQIFTTIRLADQRAAEAAVRHGLLAYDRRHGYRGPEGMLDAKAVAERDWDTLDAQLSSYPDFPEALAAVVLEASDRRLVVWRHGKTVEFTDKALDFVRRSLGAKAPEEQRLRPGAVVRLRPLPNERWELTQLPEAQAALVSLDADTGAVRALVGGYDFGLTKFNHATQGQRQPGSSFKPFIYSAALEKGWGPGSWVEDAPLFFSAELTGSKDWEPKNYDDRYEGWMRLRDAVAKSKNVVAIRVLNDITPAYAQQWITRFGLDPAKHPAYLTMALGAGSANPWEMARAYAVFANGGYLVEPYFIQEIRDAQGNLLLRVQPKVAGQDAPRVLSERNAWMMDSLLRTVVERGTAAAARARLKRSDLAGKTGTTNNQVDTWFAGYQPKIVAVSWLGFSQPRSLGRAETGGRAALPIWIEYMETALQGQPEVKRPMPEGISTVQLDDKTEYHYSEYPPPSPYPPSSEPVEEAPPPNDMTEDPFYDLIQQRRQGTPDAAPRAPVLDRPFLN